MVEYWWSFNNYKFKSYNIRNLSYGRYDLAYLQYKSLSQDLLYYILQNKLSLWVQIKMHLFKNSKNYS